MILVANIATGRTARAIKGSAGSRSEEPKILHMNTTAPHEQPIALSSSGRHLVLALLIAYRQFIEDRLKRKSVGRTRRPTPADMELVREHELTMQLIGQLEEAGAHRDASE